MGNRTLASLDWAGCFSLGIESMIRGAGFLRSWAKRRVWKRGTFFLLRIHEGGKEGWSEGLKEARLDGLCQRLLNWHAMQKYRMTDGLHGCSNDMEIEFQHALPNTNDVSHSLMIMRSSGAGAGAGAGAWGIGCEHVDPGTLERSEPQVAANCKEEMVVV